MLALRVNPKVAERTRRVLARTLRRVPELNGRPIRVSMLPELTVSRGKLLSGDLLRGTAVHAAAFIRRREIILENGLPPQKLRVILIHELFHFVWARLSNDVRCAFSLILEREFAAGVLGELGDSAAVKKDKLNFVADAGFSGRHWRDYVCESFCDTASWIYAGSHKRGECSLAVKWSARRRRWFLGTFSTQRVC